ncbi:hypothetical protein RI129_009208 [Pyrocoelia pectoralis]|uniref:Uncharacterized protein n=1 Tax=Pyrocoelia pectoralis TaxID=417401 RepID=A0AAN7ZLY8_9COLE
MISAADGTPSYEACGLQRNLTDFRCMNRSVDPCVDFYEFTCGNFKNVNQRPNEVEIWDRFIIKQEELHNEIAEILTANGYSNDPEALRKSRAAYKACMDTTYADKLEYPEVKLMKTLGSWPLISTDKETSRFSWNEVGDVVATYGVPLYFSISVNNNLLNSSQLVIMIGVDSIIDTSIRNLLDYSVDSLSFKPNSEETRSFQTLMSDIAIILRDAIGSHKSGDEILIEIQKVTEFMASLQESDNGANSFQLFTVQELQNWINENTGQQKNLNILGYLRRVFAKSGVNVKLNTVVFVTNISFFRGVLNLINETDDDLLRNFMFTKLFLHTSQDSNKLIRKANERFRLRMGQKNLSRSEYCTRFLLGYPGGVALSMAITYEYRKRNYSTQKFEMVTKIVESLFQSFSKSLNAAGWLDEISRKKASLKLRNMLTIFGYPGFIESHTTVDYYYKNVRICAWDHFGNAQRMRAFGNALSYALLTASKHREIWNRSPLIVGAFYKYQYNRIIFFFNFVYAIEYGTIGSIIGHEMAHGFDNNGHLYDENGSFYPWLTAEARVQFTKRRNCFVSQYGKYYIPEIGEYVDPNKSINENMADTIGLQQSYKAFMLLNHKSSVSDTNMSLEKLFFVAYGTMWCAQETPEYLQKLQNGNYAPNRYRVIGAVSNSEEFAKAFNCPLGSRMNPVNKCMLW